MANKSKKTQLSAIKDELNTDSAQLLLKSYDSFEEQMISDNSQRMSRDIGTLVYARNDGSFFWPAFLVQLEDKPDLKPVTPGSATWENSAMVMFLEMSGKSLFRNSALHWEKLIPINEEHWKEQLDLISKKNKLLSRKWTKKKTRGTTARFDKAVELLQEFLPYQKSERHQMAQIKSLEYKQLQSQQLSTVRSKSKLENKKTLAQVVEIPRERMQGVYSLRPAPITIIGQLPDTTPEMLKPLLADGADHHNNEESGFDTSLVMAPNKIKATKKPVRPKDGGKELQDWIADQFQLLEKSFRMEAQKVVVCAENGCGQEIHGDPPVFCHDVPFHASCVKQIEENGKKVYKCSDCLEKRCFICKSSTDENCFKCSKCDLFYHVPCLRTFPQAEVQSPVGPITCPLHFCHTCIAEHAVFKKVRHYKVSKGNSLHCIKCPTSYHRACLPAPSLSTVMSNGCIICPRHQDFNAGHKVRRLGCFICNKSLGSKQPLVNCCKCPLTYHMKCVADDTTFETPEEKETYRKYFECEACFWGLFPLPGQAVLCRQPNFTFWPARILYPKEASQRAVSSPHSFSIRYVGTEQTYYDGARCVNTVSLDVAAYNVLQKIKVITDKPKLTAYEEGILVMKLSESHRSTILNEPEPIYKKIEKNVYKTTSQKTKGGNAKEMDKDTGSNTCISFHCPCHEDKEAKEICSVGSGCVNRDQAIECDDKTCGDSKRCTNRMFSRKTPNKIEPFATNNRGWGVRVIELLKKGDFVIEYVGEVISKELYQWRITRKFPNDAHYFLGLDKNSFIDAEYMGNLSRLINHSCDPNCSTEKYMSQGKLVVGVFAKVDIASGTELTFDYAYEMGENAAKTFSCCCGSINCRGQVNNNSKNNLQGREVGDLSSSQFRRDDEWKENCEICQYADGSVLLCCEAPQCDKSYHPSCLGMSSIPEGKWICPEHKSHEHKSSEKKASNKRKIVGEDKPLIKFKFDTKRNNKRRRMMPDEDELVEVVTENKENQKSLISQEST